MKIITYFLLLLGISFNLSAKDWTLEIRAACYTPQSKETTEMYSHAWVDFQAFTAKKIACNWELWSQVSWTIKRGHSSKGVYGFKDHTRAWMVPISAGLRFIYPISCRVQTYLGAGVNYTFLRIDNRFEDLYGYSFYNSSPFKKHIYKNAFGGLFKAGIVIDTGDNTFIDLFVDYFLQNFRLGHHNFFQEEIIGKHFKANGIKCGAGFGVNF